jgi:tetratricopeptide (TPR) repeat protein
MSEVDKVTEKSSILVKKQIDELNNVAESMSAKDALVAFESANEALELSKSINYKKGQVYACHYLAESLYRQGKIYDSIEIFMQALNINVNPVDELIQSMIFTSLGNAHLYLKFYDLAFYYYRNALVLSEKLERHESSAMIYNNIGEIYRELGDFNNALNSYNSCLEICRLNNLRRVEMYATTNIGVTNYQTKHYQDAIVYLEKSLKESKEKTIRLLKDFQIDILD